ncbi:MAG: GTPase Era [Nevskiaceae bacterium]|nr:MAG: GTPase Era [Nevskiaceae bacterium]TBR73981.1 MAG: GTPase Era [Nevskiaceae bacterium]
MRSGMVAVVGRPNVGKSTLVNHLVGHKVSIVAPKPQTTRQRVQGVLNFEGAQIVFVDTPGLHHGGKTALNRYMNEAAAAAFIDVDIILHVVDAGRWTAEDDAVLQRVKAAQTPTLLVANKVDCFQDKEQLLPLIAELSARHDYAGIVPVSAMKGANCDALCREIVARLPEGPQYYPDGQYSDHGLEFAVVEAVRERLIRELGQELPYSLTVTLEALERGDDLLKASAVIWVEREGQKKIVIGKDGEMLKRVGSAARRALEHQTRQRVFLKLWVRVKSGWTDDPATLKRFGYE